MRPTSIRSICATLALLVLISGCSAVIPDPVVQQREAPRPTPTSDIASQDEREPTLSAPRSDCAARVVQTPEHHPDNAALNSYVPSRDQTSTMLASFGVEMAQAFARDVDGAFTGTTDEIFQFYACKYGLDVDLVRAAAWAESTHDALTNGDGGESWGVMQVRDSTKSHAHAHPAARLSTSYNVDYWAFHLRSCLDGRIGYLGEKTKNDIWGCVGLWYYGADTHHEKSREYIERVKRNYREQPWLEDYERVGAQAVR
jgi:hypothetical protein